MVCGVTPGETLKRYRMAADYTQEALGLAVGKGAVIAGKWENDKHVPRRDVARKLDELLKADGALM
jgi:transcriptional regulator with XRE-family HTH domain